MKCKCPACGASFSLDALLGHSDASQAFLASLNLLGDLAKPLIKYLALFRPEHRDLTFERASKLLNELAPDLLNQQIYCNRQSYPAPQKAWIWAINQMLEYREMGKLQLPLKNHNYLYQVMTSYQPEKDYRIFSGVNQTDVETVCQLKKHQYSEPSKYERVMMQQQQEYEQKHHFEQQMREHEEYKNAKPAFDLGEMMSYARVLKENPERKLKGIYDEATMLSHLQQNRKENETFEDCYQRLKKLEIEAEEKAKETENQATEINP